MDGIIPIYKPKKMTSHDVIDFVRQATGIRKVGHTGTLDPNAQGVLIVLVGRATKLASTFTKDKKEYIANITLGTETDTHDGEGKVIKHSPCPKLAKEEIEKTLGGFKGEIEQIPPRFSAKKIAGKKAYELARMGKQFRLESQKITIGSIELLEYQHPQITIRVNCSSGTYIRSLARDIGEKIGCGAYLRDLERTRCGEFSREQAIPLEKINRESWEKLIIPLPGI